jgi:hypothetical protein
MATAVQIELMVDEKGAVQGIRTFDSAIKGTAGTTGQLDASLKQLNGTMSKMAATGSGAGRGTARGLREVKDEALSTKEGLHLVQEELDLHIPRGFRNVIAQSKLAESAVRTFGGAIAAIGVAQVGFMVVSQLVEEAHKLWEEHISLTSAAREYNAEIAKAREQDVSNTQSIEDTRARVEELTEEYKKLEAAKQEASKRGFWFNSVNNIMNAHDYAEAEVDRQKQLDRLKPKEAQQQHELTLAAIDRDHSSSGLTGAAARNVDTSRRLAISEENQKYAAAQDRLLHNTTASDSGSAKRAIEDAKIRHDAAGEAARDERSQHQETLRMQAEARQASLQGEAVYIDQRDVLLAQLRDRLKQTELTPIEYRRQAAAVEAKYDAERLDRLRTLTNETEKMQVQAALVSFHGLARTQAQGDIDIAAVNETKLDPEVKEQRVAAIRERVLNEMLEAQRQYTQQVDELERESESRSLTGLARIRADAERTIAAKELAFKAQYGQLSPDSADYKKGLQQHTRETSIISGSADQQAEEYRRHSLDEVEQMESEARVKMLSAEKQQTAAIIAEYAQRTKAYKEELDLQLQSGKLTDRDLATVNEEYNRKMAAAAEMRNAEMVEAARQAREKMAGEFTRFFRDPMSAMKEMGEKAAGEMAASVVQRMQGHGAPGQTTAGFSDQWSLGKIFDRIGGKSKGMPEEQGQAHHAQTMASGAFTLSRAEIRVGMATISMPAIAGTSGGGTGGGGALSSGSTSLLGMPGTSASSGMVGEGGNTSDVANISGPLGKGGSPAFSSEGSTNPGSIASVTSATAARIGSGGGGESSMPTGAAGVLYRAQHSTNMPQLQHATISGMFDKDGQFSPDLKRGIFGTDKTNGGMLGGGGFKGNVGGAVSGGMGIYSAFEGNGGIGGAASGALSGAKLGMAVGGPIGAAIGAVGGAVIGAIGFGGREKARVYDLKTVRPRLGDDFQSYQTGGMDYMSAYSDMQALDMEARKTLGKMGGSAKAYYWDTINKEIQQAEAKLTAEEKSGRRDQTASAAQFDIGSDSVPRDGFAFIHKDERIFPSAHNERITRALEAGADDTIIQRMQPRSSYGLDAAHADYRAAMQSSGAGGGSTSAVNHTWNVRAWDAKSVTQMLMDHKHTVRAASNASYAENSGGADASF